MGVPKEVSLKASVSIAENIRLNSVAAKTQHSIRHLKWIRGISIIKNRGHHSIVKLSDVKLVGCRKTQTRWLWQL